MAKSKGSGSKNNQAKMTDDDVRLARAVFAEVPALKKKLAGMGIVGLAEKFEISKGAMADILAYRTWTKLR